MHFGPMAMTVISDGALLHQALKAAAIAARPNLRPFHLFRHGTADGCQRGVILSSGPEWAEQVMYSYWDVLVVVVVVVVVV